MFSFFKKKPAPPAAPAPAAPDRSAERPEHEPAAPAGPMPTAAEERGRGPRSWLNTDVGELLFGRKAPAPAPVSVEPAPPGTPPQIATPSTTTPTSTTQPSTTQPGTTQPGTTQPGATQPSTPAQSTTERSTRPEAAEPASPQPPSIAQPSIQPAVAAEPSVTTARSTEPAPDDDESPATRAGWLAKLRSGLQRTGGAIASAFVGAEIGEELYEDLEVALLQSDAGAEATMYLLDQLQARVTRSHVRDAAAARRLLATIIEELLRPLERPLVIGEHTPTVIMVVGVNGAGKTTSIGKLARHLLDSRQNVLLAAADTFRAAAREQLLAWAERAGTGDASTTASGRIEIVSQEGGDPAGVTFDAVVAGRARNCDVVIVDTAGRLATQAHLMEELKKMKRVIGKAEPGAPHEVLLVIDGNTGQNALAQVQAFDDALQLSGLIITKLDGTAKGGVLAAIALWSRTRAAPLPVYFVGVGEKLADLQTFRAREFASALVD